MKIRKLLMVLPFMLCSCSIENFFKDKKASLDKLEFTLNDKTGTYSVCALEDVELGNIRIPSKYNGKKVTEIEKQGFANCDSLTSIEIPNTITKIGESAFEYCISLKSLDIPNSVTSIGKYLCENCSALTSVKISKAVTFLDQSMFERCYSLSSLVVNSGNSVYDSRNNCNAIIETATNTLICGCNNTIIPNTVTTIGDYAFYGFTALTSITIPNSVVSINKGAFGYCSSLASLTIPSSVTSIGSDAFYNCLSLVSLKIPSSVTSIEEFAFSGCTSLTSVVIPASVSSIGRDIFKHCTSLTVYCEADSQPSGWSDEWGIEYLDVVWGYCPE